jgi:hypothetical protein
MRHACSNFERFALTIALRLTRARHDELTFKNKASDQVIMCVLVITGPWLEHFRFDLAEPILFEFGGKFGCVHLCVSLSVRMFWTIATWIFLSMPAGRS